MHRRRPLWVFIVALVVCQVAAIGYLRAETADLPAERAAVPSAAPAAQPAPGEASPSTAVAQPQTLHTPEHPLVGAHYHVWYPSNFDQGHLREKLDPPQEPALGRYRSDDPSVAEAQIASASAHGVDFFTIDWWPTRTDQNANALAGFLQADNIGDIDFAMFYEVWDLGFDAANEATPMEPATIDRFVSDMGLFADTFFDHPSYLRVDGRPVVILYLSRTMTGDVAGAITSARNHLAARGIDVFFIADEVFWRPMDSERMRLYDAITAYNLYSSDRPEHEGFAADTSLVEDQVALYQQHAEASGVPLVPAVFPGYNDRGVRPDSDHYAIPRRWSAGEPEGSLLRQMIDRIARPLLDPRLPMLFVTSWNEWNEDTAIEPLAPADETARDNSGSGAELTQGYGYGGGDIQVRALRDEVVAVAGRVVDGGDLVPGVRVEARDPAGNLLAADTTDSAGRFVLSRWLLPAGDVRVLAGGGQAEVTVDPDRTMDVELDWSA